MGYTNFYQFRESLFRRNFWTKALPDWIPKTRDIGKQIKAAVHERAFVKTRKQAGIWVNKLPPETRSVPMNAKQKRIQAEILKDWAVQDAGLRTQYATVREMWLWYVAGGFDPNRELLSPEKANAIIEYLRGELAGQQSVIWFKFRHEVTYLYERLRDARIPVSFILGGMKPEEEREALDGCRAGKYRVLLATELSVRFGMDCSFTDVTQYYSNELSCEARAQSQERMAHLKKQGVPLAVIDWVSQGSTDEKVIQQVRSKHTTARMLMIDFRKWVGEELGQCKT
jgi:superfamily II DNA/RNA helicase